MPQRDLQAQAVSRSHPAHAELLGKIHVTAVERIAFRQPGTRAKADAQAEEQSSVLPAMHEPTAR